VSIKPNESEISHRSNVVSHELWNFQFLPGRIERNKTEIKSMADYVLHKYCSGQLTSYMIIETDTVRDEKIIRFCKKFDVINIYTYPKNFSPATQHKYLGGTILFMKKYVPLIGKQTHVYVDYKNNEDRKKFPYPESFKKIDEYIYYSKN